MRKDDMNYSEKIYDLRKREDISQEALAALVGTTRQQVSRWECGSAVPNPKYSYALAAHFGCTVEELYGEKIEEDVKEETVDVIKDTSGFHFGNKSILISIFAIISYIITVLMVSFTHIIYDYVNSAYFYKEELADGEFNKVYIRTDYITFMRNSKNLITAWVIITSAILFILLITLFVRYLKRTTNKIARSDLYNPFIAALTFIVSTFMAGLMISSPLLSDASNYPGFATMMIYSLICLILSLYIADLFITFTRMIFRPVLAKVFVLTPWKGDIKKMEIIHVAIGIPLFIAAILGAMYIVYCPFILLYIFPLVLCYAYIIFVAVALLVHFLYCYCPFGRKKA